MRSAADLDAAVISTPDHTHFHPRNAAMQLGLHVFWKNPSPHGPMNPQRLSDLAAEKKSPLNLGAQRLPMTNMHRVVELIAIRRDRARLVKSHSWVGGSRGCRVRPTTPQSRRFGLRL